MEGSAVDAGEKMLMVAKEHKCKECNARFRNIHSLYTHKLRRHTTKVEIDGVVVRRSRDGLFRCPTCPYAVYMGPDRLKAHWRGPQHLASTQPRGGFVRSTGSALQFLESCPTLAFHSQLRLLMCVPCGYSVKKTSVVKHFLHRHSTRLSSSSPIHQELQRLELAENSRGTLPTQEYTVEGLERKDGLECASCGSLFFSTRMARNHLRFVHDGEPIRMEPCVVQSIYGGNRARYFKITNPTADPPLGTVVVVTKTPAEQSGNNALQEVACERHPSEALGLGVPNSMLLLRVALTQLLVRTGHSLPPSTGLAPASGPNEVQEASRDLALPRSTGEPNASVRVRGSGSSALASFLSPEQGMAALAALHTEALTAMDVLAVLPPYGGKSTTYLLTAMLAGMNNKTILVVVPTTFAVEVACGLCVDAGFVCGQWAPAGHVGDGPIPASTSSDGGPGGTPGGTPDGLCWRRAPSSPHHHHSGSTERRSSAWSFARLIVVNMSDVATPAFETFFCSISGGLHRVVVDDLHALEACTTLRPKFSRLTKLVRAAELNFLFLSSWLSAYTERIFAQQTQVLRIQQPVLLHRVGFRVLIADEDANMDTLIMRRVRGFMATAKDDERMAIFTISDEEAMSLAERLRSSPFIGDSVACVTFAGQRRGQRNMLGEWKKGKKLILVCPSFVSFGLRCQKLTQVVHRGSSPSLVAFAHGCGRAGQGGGRANCWLISSSRYLQERKDKSDPENEVIRWARDRENCRRQQLHLAINQNFTRHCFFDDKCQPCDVCMACGEIGK